MKITKRQLRRIIKEETTKVLAEQKIRRIVRRRLLEQAEDPYSELWLIAADNAGSDWRKNHFAKFNRIETGYHHEEKRRKNRTTSLAELPLVFPDEYSASYLGAKHKPTRVSDALAKLDPSDPVYQLIDRAAAKAAGAKPQGSTPSQINLDGLPWESLRDHPQWDEGMSDVLAVVKKNGGRGISAYMDEETASDRNDLVQLENGFKETKRINHETAMDSGTITIGTVGGQPVAVWDVMGYQTWMY